MNAKVGDTLRLYEVDGYWIDVQIVERVVDYDEDIFFDTMGDDLEYGNTVATHKTIDDLIESYAKSWSKIEIISSKDKWSDLLNGEILWVTKNELDEILNNLKTLNINTLMIQSCQDKFVIKVDELTISRYKEEEYGK